jgi:hypothetical protein
MTIPFREGNSQSDRTEVGGRWRSGALAFRTLSNLFATSMGGLGPINELSHNLNQYTSDTPRQQNNCRIILCSFLLYFVIDLVIGVVISKKIEQKCC